MGASITSGLVEKIESKNFSCATQSIIMRWSPLTVTAISLNSRRKNSPPSFGA